MRVEFATTMNLYFTTIILLLTSACVSLRAQSQLHSSGLGDAILMEPDSHGAVWTGTTTLSVDNYGLDTLVLSNFVAKPTNGEFCNLTISDSLTPITFYFLPPGHHTILHWAVSTPRFGSFDTVSFAARIYNAGQESFYNSVAAVIWVGFSSIAIQQQSTLGLPLPNPFTTHTTIGFSLPNPERVKLELFDITGQTLREIERECTAGSNEIDLDTRDLPPGCYWYRIHGGEWERSGKVVRLQ